MLVYDEPKLYIQFQCKINVWYITAKEEFSIPVQWKKQIRSFYILLIVANYKWAM